MFRSSVAVLLALLFVNGALAPSFAAIGPRTVAPSDILRLKKVSEIALSPDGRHVLFVVHDPSNLAFGKNSAPASVWTAATDATEAPHRVAMNLEQSWSPAWAPDGRGFAFLSSGAEGGAPQIYLLSNGSTDAQKLTSVPGGVDQFAWSADGQMLAFITGSQQQGAAPNDSVVVDSARTFSQLSVYALATHQVVQVRRQEGGIQNLAWSPSGREIALIVPSLNPNDYGAALLVVVDRDRGSIRRTLSKNVGESGILKWSPDGRSIAFLECVPRNVTAWWLAVAPAAGGKTVPLLKEQPLSVLDVAWTPDSRRLDGEIIDGTRNALVSIDVQANAVRKLASILSSQWNYSFSSNGRTIAYAAQSTMSPNDVWVRESDGGARKLTRLNPQTDSWRLGAVREMSWRNREDHRLVHGIVITPPGFRLGRSYATVVECHVGDNPWWYGWIGDYWAWGQLLASHGYVVFLPNTRGVSGEGWRSHETLNNWGGAAFQDLMDGVDVLVKKRVADPARLGIGGWSNGGFMSSYAITHTTRFKAAVVEDGHIDFFALFGTADWRSLILQLGTNPYFDRRPYDRVSPISTVRKIKTPTLLLWGADDPAVPASQGHELYTALKTLGIETEMVTYPREGHEIDEPLHRLDLQTRVLEWFDRHLKR